MDVLKLIRLTLMNLNEDTDEVTMEEYKEQILCYLNQGYTDVMRSKYPVFWQERINVPVSGVFDTQELSKPCVDIVKVEKNALPVGWKLSGSELETVRGNVDIKYRYMPSMLKEDDDIPMFPEDIHYAIADYAAYRVLSTGSRLRQARGEMFYNSYLTALLKLEQRGFKRLANKY